jgi:hypothetical protein
MELDKEGRRYEQYTPTLPYELSAGADIMVPDGSPYGVRFQQTIQCFASFTFVEVCKVLSAELEKYVIEIEKWDEAHLRSNGQEVRLGGPGMW